MPKTPVFTNVSVPEGAIMRNWHFLLAGAISVVIFVGLYLTAPPPPPVTDPLTGLVVDIEPDLGEYTDAPALGAVVDAEARRAAAEARRLEREAVAQDERDVLMAEQQQREQLEEIRRMREILERYRQQEAAGQEPTFVGVVTNSSEEAAMLAALAAEELRRETEAYRAPLVVSSARSFQGGRTHQIEQYPPMSYRTVAQSALAAPLPFAAGQPPAPAVQRPAAFPVPPGTQGGVPPMSVPAPRGTGTAFDPGGRGSGVPPSAPRSGFGAPAMPVGRPGTGPAGTFTVGPGAAGGGGAVPEAVITPHDGNAYRLYEGEFLPAVLETQIQGDFTGPISVHVTRPVYSRNRRRILVPRGTQLLGTASGAEGPFQERLALGFHRLIFPDGRWIELEGPQSLWGLSGMGESSVSDLVDRHYVAAFGSAGAIGLLAALSQGGGSQGGYGIQSALSQNSAQVALQLMSRFLNRRPTITIRAGHRLNVRMMTDVIIPDEVTHVFD